MNNRDGEVMMKFKNEQMEKEWQEFRNNNQDPYGYGAVSFAERWAELMETELEKGKILTDIAKKTEDQADTEGITGFMYGAAVNALSHAWKHGEALKDWHNRKYSYDGDEVVNPAIMSIGKKD